MERRPCQNPVTWLSPGYLLGSCKGFTDTVQSIIFDALKPGLRCEPRNYIPAISHVATRKKDIYIYYIFIWLQCSGSAYLGG